MSEKEADLKSTTPDLSPSVSNEASEGEVAAATLPQVKFPFRNPGEIDHDAVTEKIKAIFEEFGGKATLDQMGQVAKVSKFNNNFKLITIANTFPTIRMLYSLLSL